VSGAACTVVRCRAVAYARRVPRKRDHQIVVRVSAEGYAAIRHRADASGVTFSTAVRQMLAFADQTMPAPKPIVPGGEKFR
jgi:hypothetical protein